MHSLRVNHINITPVLKGVLQAPLHQYCV